MAEAAAAGTLPGIGSPVEVLVQADIPGINGKGEGSTVPGGT